MSGRPYRAQRLFVLLGTLLVLLVGPGFLASAHATSVRSQQWYLDSWKIDEVWNTTRGAGSIVAVVDSGVDTTHPDLTGQVLPSLSTPGDREGHGTGMASLIAGSGRSGNGEGVYGVAPASKILPFQAVSGIFGGNDPNSLANGIKLAADSPARIINLSVSSSQDFPAAREAVSYALAKGKLVIAAGGNAPKERDNSPVYPASYPGVLAVSAVNREGKPASNSVRGSWISLSAPGEEIPGACAAETRYCLSVGSSDAAALTSGVAALVWSVHPDWTANQVIRRLIDTANRPTEPVPSDTFGYGAVSPRKALAATDTPGPADVNPLVGVRGDKPSAPPTAAASSAPTAAAAPPTSTAPPATATGRSDDGNNLLVPILIGTAAVVLLAAGATIVTMRRRRTRELAYRQTPVAPPWPTPPPPHPQSRTYDGS
ncbi:S8 family serine peptidase [Embleya hyalina]|uniref:Type VII secretion-associated serine protease n=1 Tax=Embleya hyalina TaxID=516124 RepID=A0A401YP93_9ACTN|nr:S8 family serine peptidase [Embleya hyalina]GCD96367.1 type VII secretion-associated serine protease [Embleya hyalina]